LLRLFSQANLQRKRRTFQLAHFNWLKTGAKGNAPHPVTHHHLAARQKGVVKTLIKTGAHGWFSTPLFLSFEMSGDKIFLPVALVLTCHKIQGPRDIRF
jgi:hypothetical protein